VGEVEDVEECRFDEEEGECCEENLYALVLDPLHRVGATAGSLASRVTYRIRLDNVKIP